MTWVFDIRSALMVSAVLTLLVGLVLLLVSRTLAPGLQTTLRWWVAGTVLHPIGMVLLSLRDSLSPWHGVVLANLLIALAFAAYTLSLRHFFSRAPGYGWAAAIVAAIGFSSAVWGVWLPNLTWRLMAVSILLALQLLQGVEALYGRRESVRPVGHVLGITLLSGSLSLLYRAVSLVENPAAVQSVFDVSLVQVLSFGLGSILPVLGTMGLLLLCTDRMYRESERVSRVDFLTGAFNRRAIEDLGNRALASARRHGSPLTAIVVDVDHFKRINDELGHAAGDHALQEAVRRLQSQLRSEDMLGRLGGEEFLILMPSTQIVDALAATERMRLAVAATPVLTDNAEIRLTVSIGVAVLDPVDAHFSHLLQRADRAMYAAKHAGRDRVVADPTSSLLPSDGH